MVTNRTFLSVRYLLCFFVVTGYQRVTDLSRLSRSEVLDRFNYLRNSLGQKSPIHSQISEGVIKPRKVSIQGFWHNSRDYRIPALREERIHREEMKNRVGFAKLKDEMGLEGVVRVVERLMEKKELRKREALARLPKKKRVLPTE